MPDVIGDKTPKKKFKAYPIGYFHIDIVEGRTKEDKRHMFVASVRAPYFPGVGTLTVIGCSSLYSAPLDKGAENLALMRSNSFHDSSTVSAW